MGKKKKLTQSEIDGVQYRHVKTWRIALAQLNAGASMCFYVLMGMASYVANAGYGIAVAVAGVILTATRVFDGITDPIIALVIDKVNTKFGKLRIFLLIGWLIESLAVLMMFSWGSGKNHGIVFFILTYMVYVIGYTINSVTGNIIPPVMVNDPKQRPMFGVWGTVYNYLVPMMMSLVVTMVILPKFGNQYSVPMLRMNSIFCVAVSFVLVLLCCIGVSSADKPENFQGISVKGKEERVTLRDMARLLKGNRAMQMYIVSAASDKLAQQTGSQAVVSTMLFGILIGNMQLGTLISVIAMLPSIIFAILGAKYAGKHGNKESMVTWTRVALVVAVISVLFCSFADLKKVTVAAVPTILFFLLTFALNGSKMCITTATGAMCADIIDFELDRSGKFLPAAVTATYSFIDKCISSLGSTIAAGCVALIGFRTVMPQPTDEATTPILVMTMFLYYGLPIIGWICTLVAMKFSPLSKEKMMEVQKNIQEKKQAAQNEFLEKYEEA
ncbi:MAG: MFS transporter [Faecalicatena sp.]|uniref:MFS transporter n=1 Tax=Faecalicatena sp. TaxID=2005360 RepID=UPI002590AA99|nr:MFS transporter [Faecalicatena sp.]MCI6465531.1 MFS transporter [Faecalicatena sp.]MDY5617363.1 MFS transporter [Lachnospiraceae bacterium]